jgi:hypothetical protein
VSQLNARSVLIALKCARDYKVQKKKKTMYVRALLGLDLGLDVRSRDCFPPRF